MHCRHFSSTYQMYGRLATFYEFRARVFGLVVGAGSKPGPLCSWKKDAHGSFRFLRHTSQ